MVIFQRIWAPNYLGVGGQSIYHPLSHSEYCPPWTPGSYTTVFVIQGYWDINVLSFVFKAYTRINKSEGLESLNFKLRDQNGFRRKSLKACSTEIIVNVCMCLLNEPHMKYPLLGGLGVLPRKFFGFWGCKWCILVPLWVTVLQYPYPLPFKKKILFRLTLISRMFLGVGKKSEIRLKS